MSHWNSRLPPGYYAIGDKAEWYLETTAGDRWEPFAAYDALFEAAWADYESIHAGVKRPTLSADHAGK